MMEAIHSPVGQSYRSADLHSQAQNTGRGASGGSDNSEPVDSVVFSHALLREMQAQAAQNQAPEEPVSYASQAPSSSDECACGIDETPQKPFKLPGLSNVGKLSEGLYRGAQPTKEGYDTMKQMGIKTVVSFRTTESERNKEREELAQRGIRYEEIPIKPGERPTEEDMVKFLRIAGDCKNQPVYMHCREGRDRTGTMAAIYRRAEQGWSADSAKKEMDNFGYHWIPYEFFGRYKNLVSTVDVDRLRELSR